MKNYDYMLDIILVGDSYTGKTKILEGFLKKDLEDLPTIGGERHIKFIQAKQKICRLVLFDICGGEKFLALNREYLKGRTCAIIVYDITNRQSFNNIKFWINECKAYCEENVLMVLVGNKCEQENYRKVSFIEGKKLADLYKIKFYEVTYKTGKNINNLFLYPLVEKIKKANKEEYKEEKYAKKEKNCNIV